MQNEVLNVVSSSWVDFQAHKLLGAEVMWLDDGLIDGPVYSSHKKVLDENAYLIKDTDCFSELEFDPGDQITLVAERYGGDGIGLNAGGGRCGNTGRYQLKGIGATCMVGDFDDPIHTYGGLDAPLAILETIFTNLFSQLLPLGAVKIRGIIYVGAKTAQYHGPERPCWGVIMMRDRCTRPAHLLRAPHFVPRSPYQGLLTGDVGRIRKVNKQLYKSFGDYNGFVKFIGIYLKKCANQFGFARAMRIMHGALTPSNITLDGRWLDLPIASMLDGGVNYWLYREFYDEHRGPLEVARELLYGYAKYNAAPYNPPRYTQV